MSEHVPPTDEELGAMLARADAATGGRWKYDDGITDDLCDPPERGKSQVVETVCDGKLFALFMPVGMLPDEQEDANGRFAAHARQDVPRLVAEVRRLRGE